MNFLARAGCTGSGAAARPAGRTLCGLSILVWFLAVVSCGSAQAGWFSQPECKLKPELAAPAGQHWYYHIKAGTKCWYLDQLLRKQHDGAREPSRQTELRTILHPADHALGLPGAARQPADRASVLLDRAGRPSAIGQLAAGQSAAGQSQGDQPAAGPSTNKQPAAVRPVTGQPATDTTFVDRWGPIKDSRGTVNAADASFRQAGLLFLHLNTTATPDRQPGSRVAKGLPPAPVKAARGIPRIVILSIAGAFIAAALARLFRDVVGRRRPLRSRRGEAPLDVSFLPVQATLVPRAARGSGPDRYAARPGQAPPPLDGPLAIFVPAKYRNTNGRARGGRIGSGAVRSPVRAAIASPALAPAGPRGGAGQDGLGTAPDLLGEIESGLADLMRNLRGAGMLN